MDLNYSKNKYLILANAYPHPGNLYQNGFVHRRVKAYQKHGIDIEVFVLSSNYTVNENYDYDGVSVVRGNTSELYSYLSSNTFDKVLIHFVTKNMIETIKKCTPNTPIIIWIHGYEAETWHRRWFNYLDNGTGLKEMFKKYNHINRQIELLNYLYQTSELDLTFIHISKWFKESVAECDARTSTQNSYIVPNFIDGSLFNYKVKSPEQRFRILSIRPYASKKYANDLSVKAVLELSKRPYFKYLHFTFWGDGIYFNEIIQPLRKFKNIQINQGFLPQDQIAKIHKENGVFLCPTRLDSQGVSMCEAMSSGLVPISNNVAAIPEFVEHNRNGLLAEQEDFVHIANLIERLYYDSELFSKLSQNAAHDIRLKCDEETVISKELTLMRQRHSGKVAYQDLLDNQYWLNRYSELENQLYSMCKMYLEIHTNAEKQYEIEITNIKKELKSLQNFKHSIDVTFMGRIAKSYIQFKKHLKNLPVFSRKLLVSVLRK